MRFHFIPLAAFSLLFSIGCLRQPPTRSPAAASIDSSESKSDSAYEQDKFRQLVEALAKQDEHIASLRAELASFRAAVGLAQSQDTSRPIATSPIPSQLSSSTAAQTTVLDPDPEDGWWCVESIANQRSQCSRTRNDCDKLAKAIRANTLLIPNRCQWQEKAACFAMEDKLLGSTQTLCFPRLTRCDEDRTLRVRDKRDYRVRGQCLATP